MLLRPGQLTQDELQAVHAGTEGRIQPLLMDPQALPGIQASAAVVRRAAEGDSAVYGVNTGFGKLASVRIADEDLVSLQRNIVFSHAAGVGEPLDPAISRLILAMKMASLGQGASGVRWETLAFLETCLAKDLIPVIPAQGLM